MYMQQVTVACGQLSFSASLCATIVCVEKLTEYGAFAEADKTRFQKFKTLHNLVATLRVFSVVYTDMHVSFAI